MGRELRGTKGNEGEPKGSVSSELQGRIEQLSHREERVRVEAALALGESGNPAALEPLRQALSDPAADVRAAAAQALGRLGDAGPVPRLVDLLTDAYPHVRRRAVEALGEIGDGRAAGALVRLLTDPVGPVRRAARLALKGIGEPARAALAEALADRAQEDQRVAAAEALGQMEASWAVSPLLDNLSDPSPRVRLAVVTALGRLGDFRATQPLMAALQEDDPAVRKAVVEALGHLGDPQALYAVRQLARWWRPGVSLELRLAAEEALGRLQEAARHLTGRELAPVDLGAPSAPSLSGRELVPVEPTQDLIPDTGRSLMLVEEAEEKEKPNAR